MKHPIPDAALDDRLGFLGMTGSGKTYGASTCVERILAHQGRVIIPDPLGVWYGLRLMADGKTASPYDVVIFGGPHADLPITPHAGALIGETVATMRESAIIDFSQFETAASERIFMRDFLNALYRKASGNPVHLVFDEADLWAPERIMDKEGDASKLHSLMQTIVRRGRIKGLTSWLISQRPASLSKNVLSQIDGLAAFRLTASQDRKALGLWIEGQADKAQGKAILDRLPTKGQGEAVVWLPQRGILADVTFPHRQTFDSSRAPKRGETVRKRELPPINLEALKGKLASVEAETKANDPRELRKQIAELKSKLAAAPAVAAPKPDKDRLELAEKRGHAKGYSEALRIAKIVERGLKRLSVADDLLKSLNVIVARLAAMESDLRPPAAPPPREKRLVAAATQKLNTIASDAMDFSSAQRRVLASLAFWRTIGEPAPAREQVAAVAGYAAGSGNFNNILGGLKTAGAIDYPASGVVSLSIEYDGGMDASDAKAMLERVLNNPQQRILDALNAVGGHGTREQIAEASGYAAGSGNFNNLLGSLRTLRIIDYPRSGEAEITDWAKQLLA